MTADRSRRIAALRERTEGRTVAASSGDAALTAICVVASVGLAWAATYLAGGSKTALPHTFYVPVILTAIRFGPRWSLVVSVAAGVAAGPLMPQDVIAGAPQLTANWVSRVVMLILIGQLTAYLSHHSLPSLTSEIADRRFRRELDEAITTGQLRLEYQPVIDLRSGRMAGVEALVRWDHPTRGRVSPEEFIGEAERLGCITQVTAFVIAEACRQAAEWRRTEPALTEGFGVAVNISAVDLEDDALAGHISAVLDDTGLPSWWLELEMTETAMVRDVDAVVERLAALRDLGIRLAIDDFGTGESSLGYLHRFPVNVLKIDRSFLDRLGDHARGDVIARSAVALADALGLQTVAEGIETRTQADLVRAFGCDMGQGYLFSRPLRPEGIADLLADADAFGAANIASDTPVTAG